PSCLPRHSDGVLAEFLGGETSAAGPSWGCRRRPATPPSRLLSAATAGIAARVLLMIPVNFSILRLQFGMSPERVAGLLLPAIVPFNALKSIMNAALAFVIAMPMVRRGIPRAASGHRW